MVWPRKKVESRRILKFKVKRLMGQPRRRRFSHVLKDMKMREKSCKKSKSKSREMKSQLADF
jgi:hypothetical protein